MVLCWFIVMNVNLTMVVVSANIGFIKHQPSHIHTLMGVCVGRLNLKKNYLKVCSMEIKSQICTSVEQSKRLLELGLKPETADMRLIPYTEFAVQMKYNDGFFYDDKDYTPAWSLHMLILLCGVTTMFTRDVLSTAYDDQINAMENLIKNGYFNKEYLV